MKILLLTTISSLIVACLFSCGKEESTSRSMEQIYAEEGVPVKIREIKSTPFTKELHYNAVLTGIVQSSAFAKVEDRVEKVNVKVGDFVHQDDILLTFPTDNPNAQYHQAKVAYDNARVAYERIKNLYATGGISKQQLDNAEAGYEVAKANWDAASQTVAVRAPISGYVTRVDVRESDNIKKDAELVTISRMDRMKAKIWISEKEAAEVKTGQLAYAIWNDVRIEGKVVEVDMALNQRKQAFGVDVEFDNPDKILKFDIMVDVYIITYSQPEAIVVEQKNVLGDADHPYIYVARNGQAAQKPVQLGQQYKMEVEVIAGLQPGDLLITDGQMLLQPGRKINIIE